MRGGWLFFIRYLSPTYLRLYWRLIKDRRVPFWPKGLVFLALAYVIVPLDLLPDWLVFLGWVDDLILLILALIFLVRSSPPEVVAEHLQQLGGRRPY